MCIQGSRRFLVSRASSVFYEAIGSQGFVSGDLEFECLGGGMELECLGQRWRPILQHSGNRLALARYQDLRRTQNLRMSINCPQKICQAREVKSRECRQHCIQNADLVSCSCWGAHLQR